MEAPSLVDGIELLSLKAPKSDRSVLHSELSRSLLVGIGQIIVPDLEGGQRPTREILFPSTAVQDLIQKGQFPALTQTMRSSKKQGMVSLDDYLHQMIKVGFADPEKAYELALDPGYLREEIAKSIKLPIGRFEPKDPVAKKMMKDLVAAAKSRRV
jgi:Tfp pilus assembly pilus retraction ATPase PilT